MAVAALALGAYTKLVGPDKAGAFPREKRYIMFGLVAALHFLLYVTSLSFTSIAHSLAITYSAPVFTALGSWLLLREPLNRRQIVGIIAAIAGIAILTGFDPNLSRRILLGDGLALLSAICYAIYSLAGRSARHHYGLLPYATTIYSIAAVWLVPGFILGLAGTGRGAGVGAGVGPYTVAIVLAIGAAGLLPLGVGHTLYNAGLRRIPATYANLIATQEVTGGVILGALLLGEVPSASSIAGALVTLAGIALVLF